jgi:threonine dehydrogenase-like Zn-dependent dehydrogenase
MTVATAYWVVRPGEGELRQEVLPPAPAPGCSRIATTVSAVSPGTERLVGLGRVPPQVQATMACRAMAGSFALPVKYGYCVVGRAIAGALVGARVFTMHPHQDLADVADADAVLLPDALVDRRASLIPNLETAWNAVHDAEVGGGESVAVVGAGVVGLAVAHLVWRMHGLRALVFDVDADRRTRAAHMPFVASVCAPSDAELSRHEIAFHTSGTSVGLQLALDLVGREGRVIDLSWYGTERVSLDLGATFHSQRKRIIASQVGMVAPRVRATHGPRERLAEVVELLVRAGDTLDRMLGPSCAFADLPALMRLVYGGNVPGLVPIVRYAAAS